MDGLLVDSEPLWREAELEVLRALGVPLRAADCAATQGWRVDAVVRHWRARHPWEGPSDQEVAQRIGAAVVARVRARAEPKRGVAHALAVVGALGVPAAVVSSSAPAIIRAVVERLGIAPRFAALVSADGLPQGKPHPAVYLHAARVLGVEPAGCVALEDSPSGVRSARAAGMRCLAVPDQGILPREVAEADRVLGSLEELTAELLRGGPAR
ncbi:MAG: hexitol phosphatase HxpB [Deltaproteobacteria bacterium]|nr:hexitol phosphatase HxpB [Deltaproteobacteria bacterium]